MDDGMARCLSIVERLETWASIRREAGEKVEVGGISMIKSALLYRLLIEEKDPLPLPPPRAYWRPWYELIEDGRASLSPHDVQFADGGASICGDSGWEILRVVAPEREYAMTYPGRATGEWRLRLQQAEGERGGWELTRSSD
jgi:hypothetical protein